LLKIGRIYEAHIKDWLSIQPSALGSGSGSSPGPGSGPGQR
jgi:hypothetical protein